LARVIPRGMQHHTDHLDRFQPLALILGLLVPGLGQFVLGFRARAVLIATGVLGLFFGGLLIGGLDTVDRREDPIWFIGQALVGPIAFGVDYVHQHSYKGLDGSGNLRSADPGEGLAAGVGGALRILPGGKPPLIKSNGRANELGTLFEAIAGMLNLIVLIDAAFSCSKRERDEYLRDLKEQADAKARLAAQAGAGVGATA